MRRSRNRTRYTILGVLTLRPMSGYDIKKFVENSINNFWRESYGQIYPTLKVLEAEGSVTREGHRREGKPHRYVYSITAKGRSELRKWLVEPAEPDVPRSELLLKLFFGNQVEAASNLSHIERYRTRLQRGLEFCQETSETLSAKLKGHPGLPYWLLGLRQGILAQEAMLEWCDEAERTLQSLEGSPSSKHPRS